MQVEISAASGGKLYASDTFTFGRFGELSFHADAVPVQYTESNLPSVEGNAAYLDFLSRNSIQLEDRNTASNPSLDTLSDGSQIIRNGTALGADNFVRVGDTTDVLKGILSFDRGVYELQPTDTVSLDGEERPAAPDATAINADGVAEIKVASFNVLNYFTSLSLANTTADNFATPYGTMHEPRGANTPEEFARQQAKLVDAIIGTGADVLGMMEMQNNGFADGTSAIDNLVDALNAKAGGDVYAYISAPYSDGSATPEPTAGKDAIMVAIIYKQDVVKPLGQAGTPDPQAYTAFAAANRPPVAQTFSYLGDESKQFTLVVNHFKSKGDGTAKFEGDADLGDGQGQFNMTRLEAAMQLSQWLATNPTGATDGDYLLIGDFNSYAKEDPVRYLSDAGFDATAIHGGYDSPASAESLAGSYTLLGNAGDYSYVFDGLRGSLDHAFASAGLAGEVTGVTHWHINADEQILLDYNTEFKTTDLYTANPYRSSDHDPVIVGLQLNSEAGSPPDTQPPPDVLAPVLTATNPVDGASNVAAGADIVLTFSEQVEAGTGNIILKGLDGAVDVVIAVNGNEVAIAGNTLTINPAADLQAGGQYAVQVAAGAVKDLVGNAYAGISDTTTLNFTVTSGKPAVFMSEIHYDNAGSDTGEAIAVSGKAGQSLAGWSLVLYNGANGAAYNTKVLSGVIDDEGAGYGEVVFTYPTDGIQNGAPDGVALVDNTGAVVQFLSYEGVMNAIGGVANGRTSVDIGAAETSTTPAGSSLQLIGTAWQLGADTFGTLNEGLVFA